MTLSTSESSPTVEEVLRFEDLPLGSLASRRALVRWSDGTESEALRWYADELVVCEGDLIGKSRERLRSLHFRRDRDRLQSVGGPSLSHPPATRAGSAGSEGCAARNRGWPAPTR